MSTSTLVDAPPRIRHNLALLNEVATGLADIFPPDHPSYQPMQEIAEALFTNLDELTLDDLEAMPSEELAAWDESLSTALDRLRDIFDRFLHPEEPHAE
jgi:hypothetical protein